MTDDEVCRSGDITVHRSDAGRGTSWNVMLGHTYVGCFSERWFPDPQALAKFIDSQQPRWTATRRSADCWDVKDGSDRPRVSANFYGPAAEQWANEWAYQRNLLEGEGQ